MNIIEERNRLKNEIDKVNDPDTLNRISAILSYNEGSLMTDEQLAIVRERREEYLRDPSSAIPLEEFKANIKKNMAFKIIVARAAELDISDAIDWYESRQVNLGDRFYDDLISNIDYLITDPYSFGKKSGNHRELKLSIFPYLIIYDIIDDIVIIHAIFNTSKNPGKKPSKF